MLSRSDMAVDGEPLHTCENRSKMAQRNVMVTRLCIKGRSRLRAASTRLEEVALFRRACTHTTSAAMNSGRDSAFCRSPSVRVPVLSTSMNSVSSMPFLQNSDLLSTN